MTVSGKRVPHTSVTMLSVLGGYEQIQRWVTEWPGLAYWPRAIFFKAGQLSSHELKYCSHNDLSESYSIRVL